MTTGALEPRDDAVEARPQAAEGAGVRGIGGEVHRLPRIAVQVVELAPLAGRRGPAVLLVDDELVARGGVYAELYHIQYGTPAPAAAAQAG